MAQQEDGLTIALQHCSMQNQCTALNRQSSKPTGDSKRADVAIADAVVLALPFQTITASGTKPANTFQFQTPILRR